MRGKEVLSSLAPMITSSSDCLIMGLARVERQPGQRGPPAILGGLATCHYEGYASPVTVTRECTTQPLKSSTGKGHQRPLDSLREGARRCLLCWPREVQSSIRVAKESWGLLSSDCRANRPHLGLCPEANVPLQGRQGSPGCIPDAPGETGIHLEWKQRSPLCSRVATGISGSSLGGLKGVKPPEAFGERSRDWSLGHAGDDTFGPDVAPGWLSQYPGARAPIAFLQEAAVVLGAPHCEDLWILRALYGFKTCPTSLQTPRRKALMTCTCLCM